MFSNPLNLSTNLDEAEVAEARDDFDAVPLGQLLQGAAELSTLQVCGQPPDFVPVGGHFRGLRLRVSRAKIVHLCLHLIYFLRLSILTGFWNALNLECIARGRR